MFTDNSELFSDNINKQNEKNKHMNRSFSDNIQLQQETPFIKLNNGFLLNPHLLTYVKYPVDKPIILEIGFSQGKPVVKLEYDSFDNAKKDYDLIIKLLADYIDNFTVWDNNDLDEDDNDENDLGFSFN